MRSAEHRDLDVDHGVTGDHAGRHLLADALIDGAHRVYGAERLR